jgi:hypothetical protein
MAKYSGRCYSPLTWLNERAELALRGLHDSLIISDFSAAES